MTALQERFPSLSTLELMTTSDRDYRYRLVVPKPVWTEVLRLLSEEQEWCNFKSEAGRYQGKAGSRYVVALHEVWSVMYRLQDGE